MKASLIGGTYAIPAKHFVHPKGTKPNWHLLAAGSGSFWYKLGDSEGEAKTGDIVLCPPGWTLHRRSPEPLEFLSLEFVWYDDNGMKYDADTQHLFGKITVQDIPRLNSTLTRFKEPLFLSASTLRAYREHLLTDLLYICTLEREALHRQRTADTVVLNALRYLKAHAYEQVSLKRLAEQANLSQSQFCRRFRDALGISPIQFLTEIRLRKAESLLLETDYGLDRISDECGYQNGFYLSRVFTRKYGLSPARYREKNRV